MSFVATGDAFCSRGDLAQQGMSKLVKVVDDFLLNNADYLTHPSSTYIILL